jgi:uncharacterized protein YdeI (YjbR/CyaY-like superfamily)
MTVDQYILKHKEWADGLNLLRGIVTKTELEETIKWGAPVYTFQGKNILGITAFKNHFGIWFFQGALLSDKRGLLQNAQEGKTQAMRHLKFYNFEEIDEKVVNEYVLEAIENQKQGNRIMPKKRPLIIPDELKEALSRDLELAVAFEGLGLTKQRDYAEQIDAAKREETRQNRLEKVILMIKQSIGHNE